MQHPPQLTRRRVGPGALAVALIVGVALGTWSPPAGAVGDSGAARRLGATAAEPDRYAPPVRGAVIDPFRAPQGPYGAGNRGLEYATEPGETVRAIGAGTVAFAGQVAGRLVVSVDHPDGLRSSLVGLATIAVRVGQELGTGQPVGRATDRLHLGVRRDGTYLDPASLFVRRGPARLVPLAGAPRPPASVAATTVGRRP